MPTNVFCPFWCTPNDRSCMVFSKTYVNESQVPLESNFQSKFFHYPNGLEKLGIFIPESTDQQIHLVGDQETPAHLQIMESI